MVLTPFRAAALGLVVSALGTLVLSQSSTLSDRVSRRLNLRGGLKQRCRIYTLALISAALGIALLSEAMP